MLKNIKEYIKKNPVLSYLTAGVALISAIVTVVIYFEESKISTIKVNHSTLVDNLKTTHGTELSECATKLDNLKTKHDMQLSELQSKLEGLTLGLGTVTNFLSVENLIVDKDKLSTLASQYKEIGDSLLFIKNTISDYWEYQETDRCELLKLTCGEKYIHLLGNEENKKIHKKIKVHLWKARDSFKIRPTPNQNFQYLHVNYIPDELTLFPSIVVQKIDKKTIEKVRALDDYSFDLITFALHDNIQHGITVSKMYDKTRFKIFSTQKKKNIFYMHSETRFDDVYTMPMGINKNVTLDEERILIDYGNYCTFIKISVPKWTYNTDAYIHTTSWLMDIRIPSRF